jgi:hypothetical protein
LTEEISRAPITVEALVCEAILLGDLCAIKVAVVSYVAGFTVKFPDLITIFYARVLVNTTWCDVHEFSVYES